MLARVTASTQFPIPPIPPNPHGGVKEPFKLKQVKRLSCLYRWQGRGERERTTADKMAWRLSAPSATHQFP